MDRATDRHREKRGRPLDYYGLLGLRRDASFREIEAAYWRRASEQRALIPQLNEAYEVLSNAERRHSYNAEREPSAPAEPERSDEQGMTPVHTPGVRERLNFLR